MIFARRREALLEAVRQASGEVENVAAVLVTSPDNLRYLTGFSGDNGWAFISAQGTALVTDGRFWAQVEKACQGVELIKFRSSEDGNLARRLAVWLAERGWTGRLGFEAQNLTCAEYTQMCAELMPDKQVRDSGVQGLCAVDYLLSGVRLVKSADEIVAIRRAADVADAAWAATLTGFRAGMTEADFCAELEYQMQKCGARKPSFDTIVASGENGAYPHATVTTRKIVPGELVTVDFGVIVDGYCSDCTRTIWLGTLDEDSRAMLELVRRAHDAALVAVKPGMKGCELDGIARKIIADAGFGQYFSHSLGHGVGMAVHEGPGLRAESQAVMEAGMIITIEPGVYVPGKGGCRIEDLVLVTPDGYEVLSHAPYQGVDERHPLVSFY